ncbi:hypothetical protein ACFQY5_02440 [Paeniroseomonas aquatica]|uniref:ABC transporter permease n=1 Tax=Paeniroseomonas aquatica TaxID=373043 RepID=A0ABT8AFB6_9PROT|nr:hypothetical protein [Paeniroseomonas aquatica]MDN3568049.1 hypothetical protein [Paeniroseomonas aquatica]
MDPVARMALRLAMLVRHPPGRRQAIVVLVALGLALAIGLADRAFDLFPRAADPGHGRVLRWH